MDLARSESAVGEALSSWPVSLRKELVLQLLSTLPRQDLLEVNAKLFNALHKDIITSLPPELALAILANLDIQDILKCGLVSRYWGSLANKQALWIGLCKRHDPPIIAADATWSDISHHRKALTSHGVPEEQPRYRQGGEADEVDDFAASRAGLDGRGHRRTSVRSEIWERTKGPGSSSRSGGWWTSGPSRPTPKSNINNPPILSYQPLPTSNPNVNYKNLYITHLILHKRFHAPRPPHVNSPPNQANLFPRQHIISPVSSVKSGGLPGHTENIYTLSLIRHRMSITIARPNSVGGGYDTLISLSSFARGEGDYGGYEVNDRMLPAPVVGGRDWILSGSRDWTLRLWVLDGAETRVVKVFHGGHEGSVLSHFTTKIAIKDDLVSSTTSSTVSPSRRHREPKERLVAVSGGSDGTLCLWDIEHGDGKPEMIIKAHDDSILCVRGDNKHVVSSSKDRTIKVFDIHDLTCLRTIRTERENRPATAINSLSISGNYVISGAGDRYIRIHFLNTGELLTEAEAHTMGIGAIVFDPVAPTNYISRRPNETLEGTIITGSLDCTIRMWHLTSLPNTSPSPKPKRADPVSFREMLDNESISEDTHMDIDSSQDGLHGRPHSSSSEGEERAEAEQSHAQSRKYSIRLIRPCEADCDCPPLLTKTRIGTDRWSRCGRCGNKGHKDLVRGLALNRSAFVSGSYDSSLRVWDRETGKCIQELASGHSSRVLTVDADRMRVISAGLDSKLIIWDYADGLDTSFVEP